MRGTRALGLELIALGVVIAAAAVLGPFVLDVIHYRTSASGLNQITGGDAAALLFVAPACLAAGLLALRGHRAAATLALGPAGFAVYTYTQLIVGEEYGARPGNNERFFPLLYAAFVLGVTTTVTAWRAAARSAPAAPSRRLRTTAAATLLAVVLLLTGQHLPTLLDALRAAPQRPEVLASPTAFWLVKLMDLGLIAPAALAAAVALLRAAPWARIATRAIVGAYALLGASVTGMAITMLARHDPSGSVPFAVGFAALTLAFAGLAAALYRPLFTTTPRPTAATTSRAAPTRQGRRTTRSSPAPIRVRRRSHRRPATR